MPADPDRLGIYFLDVGQGDCTFVVPPAGQGSPVLFDCADLYVAERFVANHEITDLQAVVASHLDIDHIRGLLPFLLNHFKAGRRVFNLIIGLDRVPRRDRSKHLRQLIAQALEWDRSPPHEDFVLREPVRYRDDPHTLAEGPDWRIQLVLPFYGDKVGELVEGGQDPNHCSAVLRVERAGSAVLVGGDAPLGAWERLEPRLRTARAIRTPHHGGEIRHHGQNWSEFSDIYDAVKADTAVISVGSSFQYKHPKKEHAEASRRAGACRLLCTQLTPRCHPDPLDLREQALKYSTSVEWPYRHLAVPGDKNRRRREESPCAGSVVVWIDGQGRLDVVPGERSEHARLLRPRVDGAACLGEGLDTA